MEDINEHLLIADIEVSCWKDQLKQAVSHQTFFMQFNQFLSEN